MADAAWRPPLSVRLAERFGYEWLWKLSAWLDVPWSCRLLGHTQPVYKASFIDGFYLDEQWYECDRCGEWMGHAD